MKKLTILVTALCLTALTACSTSNANTSQSVQPAESTSASQSAQASQSAEPTGEAQHVQPSPIASIDLKKPADGIYAASFTDAGVHKDGKKITLDVMLYDYELFDSVEVSKLKAGDTITAGGKDLKVTDVKSLDDGGVAINGGYAKDGITLFPGDGGTYYQVKENNAKVYQELGTVSLALSDNFELTDNGTNTKEVLKLDDMENFKVDNIGFNANNTKITVENGVITSMERSYTP